MNHIFRPAAVTSMTAALLALCACSNDGDLKVGAQAANSAASTNTTNTPTTGSSTSPATAVQQADLAGDWSGEWDAIPADRSDPLSRLSYTLDSNGRITTGVFVGNPQRAATTASRLEGGQVTVNSDQSVSGRITFAGGFTTSIRGRVNRENGALVLEGQWCVNNGPCGDFKETQIRPANKPGANG